MSYRDMSTVQSASNGYDANGMLQNGSNMTLVDEPQGDGADSFNVIGWVSLWVGMTVVLVLIPILCDTKLREKLCNCLFRPCGNVELSRGPQNPHGISISFSAGVIRSRRQVQSTDALDIEKEVARATEARRIIDGLLENHTMILDEGRHKALSTFHTVGNDAAPGANDGQNGSDGSPEGPGEDIQARPIARRSTCSPCIYIPIPGKSMNDGDLKECLDRIGERASVEATTAEDDIRQLEEGVLPSATNPESGMTLRAAPVTCAICLDGYEVGDSVSWSANERCCHVFHRQCISDWMMQKPKKSRRAAAEEDEMENPGPLTGLPMTCPCCREKFVERSEKADVDVDIDASMDV